MKTASALPPCCTDIHDNLVPHKCHHKASWKIPLKRVCRHEQKRRPAIFCSCSHRFDGVGLTNFVLERQKLTWLGLIWILVMCASVVWEGKYLTKEKSTWVQWKYQNLWKSFIKRILVIRLSIGEASRAHLESCFYCYVEPLWKGSLFYDKYWRVGTHYNL